MNEEKMEKLRQELLSHFFEIIAHGGLDRRENVYFTIRVATEMLASARVLGGETLDSKYDDALFVLMRKEYDRLVKDMLEYGETEEH